MALLLWLRFRSRLVHSRQAATLTVLTDSSVADGLTMAAIPVGKGRHEDGVGGRCGVGGGGPWRRAKGQPDSQMRARGQEWTQADLAPQVFELEEASRSLWPGRGVGRGPLWVEGGENGRKGFRENAGWTGDFARGARAVPARPHRGAALAGEDGAACGEVEFLNPIS